MCVPARVCACLYRVPSVSVCEPVCVCVRLGCVCAQVCECAGEETQINKQPLSTPVKPDFVC